MFVGEIMDFWVVMVIVLVTIGLVVCSVCLIKSKIKKNKTITLRNSNLCKKVRELNKSYNFNNILPYISLYPQLKSKRSLENFVISEYVIKYLSDFEFVCKKHLQLAEQNGKMYEEYKKRYDEIKYTTEKEFGELGKLGLSYNTFLKNEKKFYEESKINKPVMQVSLICKASYTSPSGRNYYEKEEKYADSQIKRLYSVVENRRLEEKKKLEEKERKEETKREKERKLRELDKMARQLSQKEMEISRKEKEFIEATKNHIYAVERDKQEDELSIELKQEEYKNVMDQKLQLLGRQFYYGEITYQEYKKARELEKKKDKERRLNDLDVIEENILQKQQSIEIKENRFNNATRNHIYTTDVKQQENITIEETPQEENLTLDQKLKQLRKQFDNGEITYQEYKERRERII